MDRSDVILGAEDKLRESLLEVDRIYKPRVIFVLASCCAGGIGEPVEDVAQEMQSQVGAEKIIVMRAEGFNYYSVKEETIYAPRRMAEELCEPPKRKLPRSANILGVVKEVHSPGNFPEDTHELVRLFDKLGITTNSVLFYASTVDAFKRASEAEFNALICPQRGMPIAEYLEEQWGIPHGKRPMPLGVTTTINWIREVGEFFGLEKEVNQLIDEEYALIKDKWEEAKRLVDGKIALIEGGDVMGAVGRAFAWARMCADLGMRPIIFNIPPIEIKGRYHHTEFNLRDGFDPEIVYSDYAYHRRLSPVKVVEEFGFNVDDVAAYMGDVYPTAVVKNWREPIFDPSNAPKLDACIHTTRRRGYPGRRGGFRGAFSTASDLINVIQMAKRKSIPTLYGRIAGV
jgi:nitrogenase molybdenum-iron protein alpha/beta subunit